jgi:hypothetical protein
MKRLLLVVIVIQGLGTALVIHEIRKQAAWQVVESYKACQKVWNPWEAQP